MKKAYKVNFDILTTVSGSYKDYEVEIEVEKGDKKDSIENKIIEEIGKNISIDDREMEIGFYETNIKKLQELENLENMPPSECLKCEILKNICNNCKYKLRNKCKGQICK